MRLPPVCRERAPTEVVDLQLRAGGIEGVEPERNSRKNRVLVDGPGVSQRVHPGLAARPVGPRFGDRRFLAGQGGRKRVEAAILEPVRPLDCLTGACLGGAGGAGERRIARARRQAPRCPERIDPQTLQVNFLVRRIKGAPLDPAVSCAGVFNQPVPIRIGRLRKPVALTIESQLAFRNSRSPCARQ